MDIKKIESNKNDYLLFLSKEELQLLEKALLRGIMVARDSIIYEDAESNETHMMEELQDDIWDVLYTSQNPL